MRRTTILLTTAAATLAMLSACSKKTETAAPTGTAANTTATAPVASNGPINPPSRKAGLWEQTMSSDRMSQTTRICLDDATEAKMKWWGSQAQGKTGCTDEKFSSRLGGGWTFHAVCPMGESGTITTDGQATGDFNSHYTVEATSTTSGSPMAQANGLHKMKIDAVWKGACPAGWRGGDMELPGGMRMNMADAMDGKPALSGHMDRAQMEALRKQAEEMGKMKGGEK